METIDQIPITKIQRATKIVKTGAKVGVNYIKYYGNRLTQDQGQAKKTLNNDNADDIYDGLKNLKGSALKVAQMLSMEKSIMPAAYVEKFSLSQFSVPPLSPALVNKTFRKSGIEILTNSEVISSDTKGKGVKVQIKSKGQISEHEADIVLSAVGVKSNIENIGLEEVGIAVDKDKIIVDEYYKTNIPGYYAIGDVTSGQALAHVASAEGILCVEKIANHDVEPIDYENIPGCTYCAPEVASVGLTEEKAIEKGYSIKVGKFPFTASGKAQASGHSDGFVKVIFDEKYGEWLGCHMIGAGVTDMIAEAVLGRKLETTGKEILKSVHPHPTMSEALMEAVADAYDEVIHL